jgi:protein involved in sex pheromone biosynthesis
MTTVEAILYARAGNEVYQRRTMRDEEKESLMIALYKQQAEEMETSGEWATLAKVAKACKVSAVVSVRQRTLSDNM